MRYHEYAGLNEDVQGVPDPKDQDSNYDPEADEVAKINLDDTRKPVLTLRTLNRLKKIRSTKNLEMAKKQELLGIMYGLGGVGAEDDV